MHPALEQLARGELSAFAGLPPGARVADLLADFGAEDEPRGRGTLGREHRTARFLVRRTAAGQRLRVWFDAEDRVLLAVLDDPGPTVPPAELLDRLGEPDAELVAEDDLFPPLRERVFAGRGLSLISDPNDRFLVRLIAFAATTPRHYLQRLRLNP